MHSVSIKFDLDINGYDEASFTSLLRCIGHWALGTGQSSQCTLYRYGYLRISKTRWAAVAILVEIELGGLQ